MTIELLFLCDNGEKSTARVGNKGNKYNISRFLLTLVLENSYVLIFKKFFPCNQILQ